MPTEILPNVPYSFQLLQRTHQEENKVGLFQTDSHIQVTYNKILARRNAPANTIEALDAMPPK
jgi:hypothetical protein